MWKRMKCYFGQHEWSMYAGYERFRVHGLAFCKNCDIKYKDTLADNE